jgi:hypothetical protein
VLLLLLACTHLTGPSANLSADAPADAPPAAAASTGTGTTGAAVAAVAAPPVDPVYARLVAAARADDHAWKRLAELCDTIGARPAGSPELARAVTWSTAQFQADGLSAVRAEPVSVQVWIRGAESLLMTAPRRAPLAMLGLGGSVGTKGIEAPVVVVRSFDELGPQVKGKIVLFNSPMEDGVPSIAHYGTAVAYRSQGASRAAAQGAVAALVRSVTTRSLYTPHTGAMHYADGVPKIPTAAITSEDADQIARLQAAGVEVRVLLQMEAHDAPMAPSANVIAEIPGKSKEIVLIGAHLDSWDVGQGAQDDGAGVIHVMEAMRQIQALGVQPERTIRAVLYANEEHGLEGGTAYDATHGTEPHVAAIETDLGGGRPLSWTRSGSPADIAWLTAAAAPTGLPVDGEGGGADVGPLGDRGVLLVGLHPDDSHYFDIHHTRADTVDKVDPAALADGVAAVAGLAWQLANAPREPATTN